MCKHDKNVFKHVTVNKIGNVIKIIIMHCLGQWVKLTVLSSILRSHMVEGENPLQQVL